MVNRTDPEHATDRLPTDQLPGADTGLLTTGAYRPTCPDGHGDLADDGAALSCPQCGRTDSTGTSMLANLLSPDLGRLNQPLQVDPDNPSVARTQELVPVRPEDLAGPTETEPEATAPDDRTDLVAPVAEPVGTEPDDNTDLVAPEAEPAPTEPPTEEAPRPAPNPADDHPTEWFGPVREPLGKLHSATTRDELVDPDDPGEHPTPDLTTHARGTRDDGTIRTTGWLQIGSLSISSGVWAALAGATAGFALPTGALWPALVLAALAWCAWFATTRWWRPASPARNRERLPADQLQPDTPIRIHGPIGPVGVVDETTRTAERVHIRFIGGTQRITAADATCHVVDLRG
ncbi:hypothetical protein IQ251_16955 [Saccharopolyspora sp. HNM0983]|uniref:Uncharacterized protein n=1 Tax=Saccharopolyspora montiporae TaxID=2781240 RepID=A0A929BA75_9PSEU|nr:hypothetical protein [Saccharopolyspora sp. HNM0983]MBE9376142.1 hypothetical protein [Saccharopolyspora sp. HNM0983]